MVAPKSRAPKSLSMVCDYINAGNAKDILVCTSIFPCLQYFSLSDSGINLFDHCLWMEENLFKYWKWIVRFQE